MFYSMGMSLNVFAVYLSPIADALSINRTTVSILPTCINLASTFGMLFAGRIYNRFSTKRVFLIAGLVMGASYYFMSANPGLLACVLGTIILGLGKAIGSTVPISILITEWFVKKRGTILGICMMGSGFGSMVYAPIASIFVEKLGVWNAFIVHGSIMIALAFVAFILVKNSPYDIGEVPYGLEDSGYTQKEEMLSGEMFRDVYKKKKFIGLTFVVFIVGFTITANMVHLTSFFISKGISTINAGIAMSIFGGAMIIGKLITGLICDRWGREKANYYMFGVVVVAFFIAFVVNSWLVIAFIFAFAYGFATPIATIAPPLWIADLFGTIDFKRIYSNNTAMYMIGSAVGTMFIGFIVDITGSYLPSFAFSILLCLSGLVIMKNIYRSRATVI